MVGDIVVVKDDHLPMNEWKLAPVQQTLPSDDGFVRKVILVFWNMTSSQPEKKDTRSSAFRNTYSQIGLILPQDRQFPVKEPSESDAKCLEIH